MKNYLNIELYLEEGIYGAYISEDGSSGYTCEGVTPRECAEQVKEYIIDCFTRKDDTD